jgi:hypothetical protein
MDFDLDEEEEEERGWDGVQGIVDQSPAKLKVSILVGELLGDLASIVTIASQERLYTAHGRL